MSGPVQPAPAPTWHFELLHPGCVHQTVFIAKVIFLSLDSISVLGLLLVAGRLLRHRWRAHWMTIGDLFERLVLTLIAWDLVFYVVDFAHLLDCHAPTAVGIAADPDTVLHLNMLFFYLVKEGLAILILWLHGTIAYTLFAYTVQKISPTRLLRNQRIWAQVLLAALYVCVHAVLSLTIRKNLVGYYIGRMSYDALVIPVSLVVITRWYWRVIKELTRPPTGAHGGGEAAVSLSTPRQRLQQQQPAVAGLEAGSTARASTVAPTLAVPPTTPANTNNSSSVNPLNRRLALRLLLILGTTVTIWALLFLVDVGAWAHLHHGNRDTPLLVMITLRSTLARSVGLFDAIILGVDMHLLSLCKACSRWRGADARGWRRRSISEKSGGTFSGEFDDVDVENGNARSALRTPTRGSGGAKPASFLARPAMLRQHSHSAGRLPRSGGSAVQLLGLGGGSTRLLGGATAGGEAAAAPEEEANAVVRAAEALRRARAPPLRPRQLRVWVSTWNMGGVELDAPAVAPTPGASSNSSSTSGPTNRTAERCADVLARLLPRWLPGGQDLYVIGVQECACLPQLRELLRAYLASGGGKGGEAYVMFKTEIGDASIMHGFIALTIFVREGDVASGAFRLHQAGVGGVATGVSLGPMGRAANKGTTGLSCRYHDATLAFLVTHFCSDNKGKSRLECRNRDAATALRELALVWDAGPDVDVQALHRFTFLLGDLNYRNLAAPAVVLRHVARAARRMQDDHERQQEECDGTSSSNWRAAAYARLLNGEHKEAEEDGGGDEPAGPYLPYTAPTPALARVLQQQQRGHRRGASSLGPHPSVQLRASVSDGGSLGSNNSSHIGEGARRLWRVFGSYFRGGGGRTVWGLVWSRTKHPPMPSPVPITTTTGRVGSLSTLSTIAESGSGVSGSGAGLAADPEGALPASLPLSHSFVSYASEASRPLSPTLRPAPAASLRSVRLSVGDEEVEGWGRLDTGDDEMGLSEEEEDIEDEEPWAWVTRVDELTLSRRGRLALWGFRERAIEFPPSYRWHRSRAPMAEAGGGFATVGLAGDYTSLQQLARDAYTISTAVGPPSSRIRRSSTNAFSISATGNTNRGNGGVEEEDEPEEGGPPVASWPFSASAAAAYRKITRTPSYTDRVLAHAQPGYGDALRWLGYDMADGIELSDHRPVSAAFRLEVDGAVRGFEVLGGGGEGEPGQHQEGDIAVFTLTLRNPTIEWWAPPPPPPTPAGRRAAAAPRPSPEEQRPKRPHEAGILFPIVSEDPLAKARLATALGEALPGVKAKGSSNSGGGSEGGKEGAAELTTNPQRHVRWDAFPLCFQAVASKRFSEHLVIKLYDERGQGMGQAVIPVVFGLPPTSQQQPPQVSRRLRFPLALAGVFKGWLILELKVETSPLKRL